MLGAHRMEHAADVCRRLDVSQVPARRAHDDAHRAVLVSVIKPPREVQRRHDLPPCLFDLAAYSVGPAEPGTAAGARVESKLNDVSAVALDIIGSVRRF